MQLSVEYHTVNEYDSLVKEALFDLLVLPCTDAHQRLISHKVHTSIAASVSYFRNVFGFEVARVKPLVAFNRLELNMSALVDTNYVSSRQKPLPPDAQFDMINSREFIIDHHIYLQYSGLTRLEESLWQKVPVMAHKEPVQDFLERLNHFVHQMIAYEQYVTTVHTTAMEAIALGSGVCQDYTHIFQAIARHNKVPCRYVSGYINQGHNFLGDLHMHAWAEAYIPGRGWQGYDPTNNIPVNENFIKVAHGSDYSDCSPLRGVLMSKGSTHSTRHVVKVTEQA